MSERVPNPAVAPAGRASHRRLRVALAARAYAKDEVRLADRDLAGCDHLVATRHGLFAVSRSARRLIAHGLFYGLTIAEETIYAFEACDEPRANSLRGRIVQLRHAGGRIVDARVFARGLSNGCHQIDLIGDTLFVTDTYRQRICAIAPDQSMRSYAPVPCRGAEWAEGYAHINSLLAYGDRRLLMLHNGADHSGRPSEVAVLDAQWRLLARKPLPGSGCHNLAILEDGTLLACGSYAGELIGSNGMRVNVSDLMTRGLSVGEKEIAIGGSTFSERDLRDDQGGEIVFLDRRYRVMARLPMPVPPMEIRRIDGADLSLSHHVHARGLTVRWPD